MRRLWETLTWGPLYFVRRVICALCGHDWTTEHSCDADYWGTGVCRRCLRGA